MRPQLFAFGRGIARVGLAQGLVQVLSLGSGLVIVRTLRPDSYALYSLAFSGLGMMSVIADSGISAGAMSEAGRVWQDPEKLGDVVATVRLLRHRFASWIIALTTPLLIYQLIRHGASWLTAICLAGFVDLQFILALQASIYGLAPSMHQLLGKTQRIAVFQNGLRLLSIGIGLIFAPTALMATVAAIPAQIWSIIGLRKLSSGLMAQSRRPDHAVRTRIMQVVARIMPGAVYYALSGQITVWLISMFGNTAALAGIGALGRLSQLFTVISAVFLIVFTPRFARLDPARHSLATRYFQILALALFLGMGIVVLVSIFPGQTLWILGRNYASLQKELRLQAIFGMISLLAGISFQLGSVRSIVVKPMLSIPLEIAVQLLFIKYVALDTAKGVLTLAIATAAIQFAVHISYFCYKITRSAKNQD